MMKKEYMTPELEEMDLEFEGPLMDISTTEDEPGEDFEDL